MTADEVREKLEKACRSVGGQRIWARQHGLSESYIGDILRKKREPAGQVLKALKIKRIISYVEDT